VLAVPRRPVACSAEGYSLGGNSLDLRRGGAQAVGPVMRGSKGVADSLDALHTCTPHSLTRHSHTLMGALAYDVPGTIDFPGGLPGERWNGVAQRALGGLIVLDAAVSDGMDCQSTWTAAAYRLRVFLVVVVSERRASPGLRAEDSVAKLQSEGERHRAGRRVVRAQGRPEHARP